MFHSQNEMLIIFEIKRHWSLPGKPRSLAIFINKLQVFSRALEALIDKLTELTSVYDHVKKRTSGFHLLNLRSLIFYD